MATRKSDPNPTVGRGGQSGLIKPKLEESRPPVAAPLSADTKSAEQGSTKESGKSAWSFGSWKTVFSTLARGSSKDKLEAGSELIKPRLEETVRETPPGNTGHDQDKGKSPEETAGDRRAQLLNSPSKDPSVEDKPDFGRSRSMTDRRAFDNAGKSTNGVIRDIKEKEPTPSSTDKTPKSAEEKSKRSIDTDLDESRTPFKKHDHAKYVSVIRKNAIDKLNREKNCDYARVCRDDYTDEWSLTLYYKQKQKQNYHYVTYVWDEIDGKWDESFVSERRPLSGWKHHLSFSSAGKACKTLKGGQEP